MKEKDLSGHLENGEGEEETTDASKEKDLSETDYQLYEALNLLKAINVLNRAPATVKSDTSSNKNS